MEQKPMNTEGGEPHQTSERPQRFQFGPWLFNVNEAKAIIAEQPRDTHTLVVHPWAHFYGLDSPDGRSFSIFRPGTSFNPDYALTTDLHKPLIVATLRSRQDETFPLLIDGTHRLYHAHIEGVTELPAHVLTVEETLGIREDAYHR